MIPKQRRSSGDRQLASGSSGCGRSARPLSWWVEKDDGVSRALTVPGRADLTNVQNGGHNVVGPLSPLDLPFCLLGGRRVQQNSNGNNSTKNGSAWRCTDSSTKETAYVGVGLLHTTRIFHRPYSALVNKTFCRRQYSTKNHHVRYATSHRWVSTWRHSLRLAAQAAARTYKNRTTNRK